MTRKNANFGIPDLRADLVVHGGVVTLSWSYEYPDHKPRQYAWDPVGGTDDNDTFIVPRGEVGGTGAGWRLLGGGAPSAHASSHAANGSDPLVVASDWVEQTELWTPASGSEIHYLPTVLPLVGQGWYQVENYLCWYDLTAAAAGTQQGAAIGPQQYSFCLRDNGTVWSASGVQNEIGEYSGTNVMGASGTAWFISAQIRLVFNGADGMRWRLTGTHPATFVGHQIRMTAFTRMKRLAARSAS